MHTILNKEKDAEFCELCGGKGEVNMIMLSGDMEEVDCPDCKEEADFSGATEQER